MTTSHRRRRRRLVQTGERLIRRHRPPCLCSSSELVGQVAEVVYDGAGGLEAFTLAGFVGVADGRYGGGPARLHVGRLITDEDGGPGVGGEAIQCEPD